MSSRPFSCYNILMIDWNFSFGWFFFGMLLVAAGAAIVVFYRQISNNFAHGLASYDRTKLVGIITIGLGLLVMMNLHTAILTALVKLVFKR